MQKHKIEILPSAQNDIEAITDYLIDKDIAAAIVFVDDIDRALTQLSDFPSSAEISKDARLAGDGYRALLLVYRYLLFYKLHDSTVYIYRLIDARQDYGAFV